MQKNKDICKVPYYYAVDPHTMQKVQNELRIALPLLNSRMMQSYSEEEYCAPTKKGKLELLLREKYTE